jgi:hypothetical protein
MNFRDFDALFHTHVSVSNVILILELSGPIMISLNAIALLFTRSKIADATANPEHR